MVVRNSRGIARHEIDLLDLIVAIHVHDVAFRTVVERIGTVRRTMSTVR
jgi:hypothetical protein